MKAKCLGSTKVIMWPCSLGGSSQPLWARAEEQPGPETVSYALAERRGIQDILRCRSMRAE